MTDHFDQNMQLDNNKYINKWHYINNERFKANYRTVRVSGFLL